MSTLVPLQVSREVPSKPLDEAVWQAWAFKGRAQDRRNSAARMQAVRWVSIAGLLAAAGLWSHLAPYDLAVRFLVAACAMVVMFQAFHARHYAFAAVFGALVLLYNPVVPVFSFSGDWLGAVVMASAVPFLASLAGRNPRRRHTMTALAGTASRAALTSLLVCGVMSAATLAGDLSRYRNFQFGTDLPTIAKQVRASVSQAKVIHSRPALIQELEWRPQPLGPSVQTEAAKEVVFGFYDGQLFRIVVNYDRYETEGLTAGDLVEAISANYGIAAKPAAPAKAEQERFGDQEEVIARWQDPQYCFDLIRSSYGPSFRLVGVLKSLEAPAQAAILEATRLDSQEAPQRDAERIVREEETERAKLDKARLANKPKFRP